MTEEYQTLISTMRNDVKDRHVLAAVVACKAHVIITSNLHDFPDHALAPYGIEAQSPDTFLMQLVQNNTATMIQILTEQAADLRNPPRTVQQELDQLALFAPTFAQDMRLAMQQQEDADS